MKREEGRRQRERRKRNKEGGRSMEKETGDVMLT